jgi:hypothetical protein
MIFTGRCSVLDFMSGFSEPKHEASKQWQIWENYKAHEQQWDGMENDPHDHCDALYGIPYVDAILKLYQSYVPDDAKHILEIGCAQGYILNHVGGPGSKRTGVDFNTDRVRKGRLQYPDTEFIVGDVRTLPLGKDYDYVLLPGVLEHVRYQEARELIHKALNICTPGGMVLFDLPWWSGQKQDFNSGIHMNPTHAWTCTSYRWDWLFKDIDVEAVELPEYPFYTFGAISSRKLSGALVGCWGKIGDILHAMPAAQKLHRQTGNDIHVAYAPDFAVVGDILDQLEGITSHSSMRLNYEADDLGIDVSDWTMVVNASHSGFRKDTMRGWNIFGWWDNDCHAIDFAAANAGLELHGEERYLQFKPGIKSRSSSNMVVFLSNTGDPGMRGLPEEWFSPLKEAVLDLGGMPVECSLGPICVGHDFRRLSLGHVVRMMSTARLVVSVDTLASGLLAQSLGTPILRLYRGATKNSATGPPDRDWAGCRWETDGGHNRPASQKEAIRHIHELWDWKEQHGAS